MSEPPCPRRDKWFRGCRFEPRYDKGEPREMTADELYWFDITSRVEALRTLCPRTYIHDLCVTCGKVVDRGGAR